MPEEKKVDESGTGPVAPPPEFPSLVASIAAGALMALEGESEAGGKAGPPDFDRARYAINLLDMLAAKTKGNLAPDEERHLAAVLHRLRLEFVEASRRPAPPPGAK